MRSSMVSRDWASSDGFAAGFGGFHRAALMARSQRAQDDLTKEYTLNH